MGDPLFAKYGKSAAAGEVLFRAGETGREMFVVRSGEVRVFLEADGVQKTLALLGPGEFVGEMSLLTGQPRSASAAVEKDAELLVVGTQVLEEMVVHNTEIALRLMRKLARRLESTDALVQILLHREGEKRVIENLKRLAKMHGWAPGHPVKIQADPEAMAEQVGLDLDEVNGVLSRLLKADALRQEQGAYVIASLEKLDGVLKFLQMKKSFK